MPPLPHPQNNIPVLSPALTDGSLGDMIFFHSYKKPGLVLDIVEGEARPHRAGGVGVILPPMAASPPAPWDMATFPGSILPAAGSLDAWVLPALGGE